MRSGFASARMPTHFSKIIGVSLHACVDRYVCYCTFKNKVYRKCKLMVDFFFLLLIWYHILDIVIVVARQQYFFPFVSVEDLWLAWLFVFLRMTNVAVWCIVSSLCRCCWWCQKSTAATTRPSPCFHANRVFAIILKIESWSLTYNIVFYVWTIDGPVHFTQLSNFAFFWEKCKFFFPVVHKVHA